MRREKKAKNVQVDGDDSPDDDDFAIAIPRSSTSVVTPGPPTEDGTPRKAPTRRAKAKAKTNVSAVPTASAAPDNAGNGSGSASSVSGSKKQDGAVLVGKLAAQMKQKASLI